MNSFKMIGRLITDPLGAVVICAGGGFALWYFVAQPPADASKTKQSGERTIATRAIAATPQKPVSDRTSASPTTGRIGNSPNPRGATTAPPLDDGKKAITAIQHVGADEENGSAADGDETNETSPSTVTTTDLQRPRPAINESKVTSASPESVLESRGLTRVRGFYVVATETEIDRGFKRITPIFNLMDAAYIQCQTILETEQYVQGLDDQRIAILTRIGEIDISLASIAQSRVPVDQVLRRDLQSERQTRSMELNDTIGLLAVARKRLVPQATKQAVYQEFLRLRNEFLEATTQFRPTVDKARDEYAELRKDAGIKDAIATLARRLNSPIRLGPSKGMNDIIAKLTRAERMVSLNPDAYRRKSKPKSTKRKS